MPRLAEGVSRLGQLRIGLCWLDNITLWYGLSVTIAACYILSSALVNSDFTCGQPSHYDDGELTWHDRLVSMQLIRHIHCGSKKPDPLYFQITSTNTDQCPQFWYNDWLIEWVIFVYCLKAVRTQLYNTYKWERKYKKWKVKFSSFQFSSIHIFEVYSVHKILFIEPGFVN